MARPSSDGGCAVSQSGYVHVEVEKITGETEKAFAMTIAGEQHWIPKSQMADPDDYEVGDEEVTVSLTEWIAEEKGL